MFRFLLIFVAVLALPLGAAAQQEIQAPFGLEWGEVQSRVQLRLARAKAKVVEKREVGGRDMWVIEGLKQPNLTCSVFYFRGSGLVEVELQYQGAKWKEAEYNQFFSQLRQKIDANYGQGRLAARSKIPDGEITQTLVSYEWVKGSTAIQIVYFAAEKTTDAYRAVSLHYKVLD